ncbi:Nose resistant to fluoxetine protein 6 [Halotydeus destructor]|nr:Nose resistant to fluoxetine protein 6 [Halotydeus destructor]
MKCSFCLRFLLIVELVLATSLTTTEEPEDEETEKPETEASVDNDPFIRQVLFHEKKIKEAILEGSALSAKGLETLQGYNVSMECMATFGLIATSLENLDTWALRLVDSSSKIPEGMMYGTLSSFGNYDECLDIEGRYDTDDPYPAFYGKYCAVDNVPMSPLSYNASYLEKLFSKSQVMRSIIKQGFTPTQISIGLRLAKIRVGYCFPSNCSFSDLSKVGKYFLATIADTVPSRWRPSTKSGNLTPRSLNCSPRKLIKSLSLGRNFARVTSVKPFDEQFKFLYGLRFVSVIWVLYGHTYLFQNILSVGNTFKLRNLPKNFFFQLCLNGTLAAESFIFLNGFMVALVTFKSLSANLGHFNFVGYYLKRLWRQVPLVLMVISLVIIWPLMGSGPIWTETMSFFSDTCRTKWWASAFFFVNYENLKDMCLFHTWFLALDTQLYVIAPILIFPLYKHAKVGCALIAGACSMSMAAIATQTIINKYPPVPIFRITTVDYLEKLEDYVTNLFFKPMVHISPYSVAILCAYLVFKGTKITLPSLARKVGWAASFACKVGIIFAVYPWNKGTSEPSAAISAIYAATCRTIWALTLTWDIIMLSGGSGGALGRFLSWPPFVPLARLTLPVYLIHPMVMIVFAASNRAPYHFSHFLMVRNSALC